MALEPKTERLLRELFQGHVCWQCGQPAVRLVHHHFCCDRHLPGRYRQATEDCKIYRTPRFGKVP